MYSCIMLPIAYGCWLSLSIEYTCNKVLASMASPAALAALQATGGKKKPLVSDFSSAITYLEQAAAGNRQ